MPPLVHFQTNSTYFLWDVLTAATFGKEELVEKEVVYSKVAAYGASQGKTYKDKDGRPVNLVHDVAHDDFFEYITALAKQN